MNTIVRKAFALRIDEETARIASVSAARDLRLIEQLEDIVQHDLLVGDVDSYLPPCRELANDGE